MDGGAKMKKNFIIKSLLDLDYYKLTMAQLAFFSFRDTEVEYGFKNRSSTRLMDFVDLDKLIAELENVGKIRFTKKEIAFLRKQGIFKEEFLSFLQNDLRLPEVKVEAGEKDPIITTNGKWCEIIFWETIVLSIVNELYYRSIVKNNQKDYFEEGKKRLAEKIKLLKENSQIRFTDFGTRRRFSREWHEYVVSELAQNTNMMGTSNVYLAMKYGLKPIGTFAHETYMVFSGVFHGSDDEIRASHNKVLQYWWDLYGEDLSIALSDTYGTDFFLKDMTLEQAKKWRGLRQDSGDPINFGEKVIRFYEEKEIDPRTKVIVFSDGLDIEKILEIEKHFRGRIQCSFGWGTNLTNDLGLKALSLIMKAIKSNGHGTVKLSDNLNKAMGYPDDIKRFIIIFAYTNTLREECVY